VYISRVAVLTHLRILHEQSLLPTLTRPLSPTPLSSKTKPTFTTSHFHHLISPTASPTLNLSSIIHLKLAKNETSLAPTYGRSNGIWVSVKPWQETEDVLSSWGRRSRHNPSLQPGADVPPVLQRAWDLERRCKWKNVSYSLAFGFGFGFEFIHPCDIGLDPTHGGNYAMCIERTKPSGGENRSSTTRRLHVAETIRLALYYQ